MEDLRALIESDLEDTLEGDFGLPIVLISPLGVEYSLRGQVVFDTRTYDPISGAEIVVPLPVAVVRRSSLPAIPLDSEKWVVRIPSGPSSTADLVSYYLERPKEDGRSIGFVNLYLTELEQS